VTLIATQKAALRHQLRHQLRLVSPPDRLAAGVCARNILVQQSAWLEARTVLFFAPLPDELDVWPLLELALGSARRVALPRYLPHLDQYEAALITHPVHDIILGQMAIREPHPRCPTCPLNQLDLVLVPGVAFDPCGRRLGRGKGFYDRLLAAVAGVRCGVALDIQLLPIVPTEPHDQLLDCILTPTRWVACSQRAA
jgi:5-formyltetrahydrofolate cyclo-ligase